MNKMFPKHKLQITWTCSNYIHHQHKWKWSAWICEKLQMLNHLLETHYKAVSITFTMSYFITTFVLFMLEGV